MEQGRGAGAGAGRGRVHNGVFGAGMRRRRRSVLVLPGVQYCKQRP